MTKLRTRQFHDYQYNNKYVDLYLINIKLFELFVLKIKNILDEKTSIDICVKKLCFHINCYEKKINFLYIHRIFDCLLSRFLNRYCHDSQKILLKNVEKFDQICFREIFNCEYSKKKNRDNKSELRVEYLKNVDKTLQIDFQKIMQMIFFSRSIIINEYNFFSQFYLQRISKYFTIDH